MPNANRDRGIRTELEACRLLEAILHLPYEAVQRKVAEGTRNDPGDLIGLPDCTIQVSRVADRPTAINDRARLKLAALAFQQQRAGTRHGVVLLRIDGAGRRPGVWRAAISGQELVRLDAVGRCHTWPGKSQGWIIRHAPDTVTGGWHEITAGRYAATVEEWAANWRTTTTTKENR